MVTEVRQGVTRDQLGRRGAIADPVWVNRRLLLTGADQLSAKPWKRLGAMRDNVDPTQEIRDAWGKERLRMLLAEQEPAKIRWRLADFYDAAIDAAMPEATGSRTSSKPGGQRSWSPSPRTSPTPAPKGSTESPNGPNASDVAIGISATTKPYPEPHRGHPTA
jgi:hypothetical protein